MESIASQLKQKHSVHCSDEEVHDPPEVDSNEDLSDDGKKEIPKELRKMEGSVDEGSTKSDEEYNDFVTQYIQENGYWSDEEEEFKATGLMRFLALPFRVFETALGVNMHLVSTTGFPTANSTVNIIVVYFGKTREMVRTLRQPAELEQVRLPDSRCTYVWASCSEILFGNTVLVTDSLKQSSPTTGSSRSLPCGTNHNLVPEEVSSPTKEGAWNPLMNGQSAALNYMQVAKGNSFPVHVGSGPPIPWFPFYGEIQFPFFPLQNPVSGLTPRQ